MKGFAHGLNSGLLHISARMDMMATQDYPVSSSMRISVHDKIWMLSLSKAQLEALDRTPISILRFTIPRAMYSMLPDTNFAKSSFNNYLLAEGSNFIYSTKSDPYLSLGILPEDLDWFTEQSFIDRIGICDHESFDVRIRVEPKKLKTENTKEAALTNTRLLLSTELNHRTKQNGGEYDGYIAGYGHMPHETQIQMKEMLVAGVRVSLVAAATSQPKQDVLNFARRIHRTIESEREAGRGRLQSVTKVYKTKRDQSELFMLIYRIVGGGVKYKLNAKAAIYAYSQFRFMMLYMGYELLDIIDINDAFVLANGTLSGVLMWTKCGSCSMNVLQYPDKPIRCPYCNEK